MPFRINIGPCCSRFIDSFVFGEIQNKLIAENLLADVILLVYCTALHMSPIPPKLRNKVNAQCTLIVVLAHFISEYMYVKN